MDGLAARIEQHPFAAFSADIGTQSPAAMAPARNLLGMLRCHPS